MDDKDKEESSIGVADYSKRVIAEKEVLIPEQVLTTDACCEYEEVEETLEQQVMLKRIIWVENEVAEGNINRVSEDVITCGKEKASAR